MHLFAGLAKGLVWPPGSSTGYQVDIIGFDACLMSMYEVGTSFSPYTRYLLGSELLEPGIGWDYTVLGNITALASAQGDVAPQDVGGLVVRTYMYTCIQVRGRRASLRRRGLTLGP